MSLLAMPVSDTPRGKDVHEGRREAGRSGSGVPSASAARMLWALSREPALQIDGTWTIVAANDAFGRLMGRPDDAVSRRIDLYPQNDRPPIHGAETRGVLVSFDGTCIPVCARTAELDHGTYLLTLEDLRECSVDDDTILPRVAEQRLRADAERERADALERAHRELAEANERLCATQSELVRASRLAGMAEVASSVLHDVGNVLNSIVVTTGLLREDLSEHEQLDDRTFRRFQRLEERVTHLRSIVAQQQKTARSIVLRETVAIESVIDEAIGIATSRLPSSGTEVVVRSSVASRVEIDRHKTVRILSNLLSNACDAVAEMPPAERMVLVTASLEGDDLVITVSDNGKGIPEHQRVEIFSYGFSTKKDGNGFGLHGAANTARELGGSLQVTSAGLGYGATFTLRLPAGERKNV